MVVLILKPTLLVLMLNLVTRIFVAAEAQIDLQNQKLFEFVFVSCLMLSTQHPIHMVMVLLSINSIDQTLHQGKSVMLTNVENWALFGREMVKKPFYVVNMPDCSHITAENNSILKQFSVFLQIQQALHPNSPL